MAAHPGWDVGWSTGVPGPNLLVGLDIATQGASDEQRAMGAVRGYLDLWGVSVAQLQHLATVRSQGRTTVRYGMAVVTPLGLASVLDRVLAVTLDHNQQVISVSSDLLPVQVPTTVAVPEGAARKAACQATQQGRAQAVTDCSRDPAIQSARLAIAASPDSARLVWALDVWVRAPLDRRAVLVDATTGALLSQRPVAQH